MTPAEHYAAAEQILVEVGEAANELGPQLAELSDSSPAAELTALMVQLGLAEAQVHATLATVDPDVLWPQRIVEGPDFRARVVSGAEMKKGCTCPSLASNPLARTSTDPDCPLHGQGKD